MYIFFKDGFVTDKLIYVQLLEFGTVEYLTITGKTFHCGIDDIAYCGNDSASGHYEYLIEE